MSKKANLTKVECKIFSISKLDFYPIVCLLAIGFFYSQNTETNSYFLLY